MDAGAAAPAGELLSPDVVRDTFQRGLAGRFTGRHVLVLVPDHTRTLPLPELFRITTHALGDASKIDFMVALGTHPPLTEMGLCSLFGLEPSERTGQYGHVGLLNHVWDDPNELTTIGTLTQDRIESFASDYWHPTLSGDVEIRINQLALEVDHILILGPVFPHEVAGFSGGVKYLFPGISGPEMINSTHWLGALAGVVNTIGIAETPVRAMINAAAEYVSTPITLCGLVVEDVGLSGVFVGDQDEAWAAAAALSTERHIRWVERPFRRILSWAPTMYDELWTAGKAMYKLEPALAEGGELIIFAPHLSEVSCAHGNYIHKIGYHVLEYFLAQWNRFKDVPLGVIAHSTHVRGAGRYDGGIEYPRAQVTLATKLDARTCELLGLGYEDPTTIDPRSWADREDEGILFVPKAGEILYRVKPS
jgi:nickel-dependent lactate racemase